MIDGYRSMRARWTEKQVYRRVMEMLDDPKHGPTVAQWMARDPARRDIYRRVSSEIGRASDAAARLPELADRMAGSETRRNRVSLWSASALALAAVAVTGVGLALFHREHEPAKLNVAAIATPATERAIQLDDGSRVTVQGHAQIIPAFTARERTVRLIQGRAVFRVAHDTNRPFIVFAGGGSVRATGTEFEVSAGRAVAVRMISGTVLVTIPGRNASTPRRVLAMRAGQQMNFESHSPSASKIDHAGASNPRTIFDDAPLAMVVAQTNDLSATKIVITEPELLQRRVFAEIYISDSNRVALKLASLFGLAIDCSIPGEIRLKRQK